MFCALFGREVCDVVSLGSRRAPALDLELLEVLLWAGKFSPGGSGLLCDWGKNWGDTEALEKTLSLNMGPANRLKEFDTSTLYEW